MESVTELTNGELLTLCMKSDEHSAELQKRFNIAMSNAGLMARTYVHGLPDCDFCHEPRCAEYRGRTANGMAYANMCGKCAIVDRNMDRTVTVTRRVLSSGQCDDGGYLILLAKNKGLNKYCPKSVTDHSPRVFTDKMSIFRAFGVISELELEQNYNILIERKGAEQ